MSGASFQLHTRKDEVVETITSRQSKILKPLAQKGAELTQFHILLNDQVDTGFMLESVYAFWPDGSDYDEHISSALTHNLSRSGRFISHETTFVEEQKSGSQKEAGVAVAANYAIYQELSKPFLQPAMDTLTLEDIQDDIAD